MRFSKFLKNALTVSLFGCIVFLLSGCASPYAEHLKSLDADYAAGRIPAHAYYPTRTRILEAENQLRAAWSAPQELYQEE